MTSSAASPPPVPRLDVRWALDVVAQQTGVRLAFERPCSGGAVGAAYVRWPDGRRSVLTSGRAADGALIAAARSAGVPAPRHELVAVHGAVTVVVQELLPGTPPAVVDAAVLQAMLDVHERFAGLLPGRAASIPLHLRASGPGFCLHETLAAYDTRTRRLLGRVREIGAQGDSADGCDLVHVDFHTGNVLFDGGALTGIVDWDGAGPGDRRLDLVTLRFDLARRAPALLGALDERLATLTPPERLRAYWAHMSLRMVDWAIRHHSAADVGFWLQVADGGPAGLH